MEKNNGHTLLAFCLGALAGGAVALLFAPASGRETRRKIKEKAESLKTKGEDLLAHSKEGVKKEVGAVKEAFNAARHAYQKEHQA